MIKGEIIAMIPDFFPSRCNKLPATLLSPTWLSSHSRLTHPCPVSILTHFCGVQVSFTAITWEPCKVRQDLHCRAYILGNSDCSRWILCSSVKWHNLRFHFHNRSMSHHKIERMVDKEIPPPTYPLRGSRFVFQSITQIKYRHLSSRSNLEWKKSYKSIICLAENILRYPLFCLSLFSQSVQNYNYFFS